MRGASAGAAGAYMMAFGNRGWFPRMGIEEIP